jgi:hypothetical protein
MCVVYFFFFPFCYNSLSEQMNGMDRTWWEILELSGKSFFLSPKIDGWIIGLEMMQIYVYECMVYLDENMDDWDGSKEDRAFGGKGGFLRYLLIVCTLRFIYALLLYNDL